MSAEIIRPTKLVKAAKSHKCSYCECHIEKGECYNSTALKYDDRIYTWKSHPRCDSIANELRMFDDCDDGGVTTDDFQEWIQGEFDQIWRKKDEEYFESKSFVYPKTFKDQLDFVCQHHAIGIEATPNDSEV